MSMQDTLFFNPLIALETALQQHEIETIPNHPIKALQICYYIGEKITDYEVPKNCIHIELENLYNYFATTKNRLVNRIDVRSNELEAEEAKMLGNKILEVINLAQQERVKLVQIYAKKIIDQSPDFNDDKLRVFIPTIRESTVLKHVAKNLAETFEQVNYEVFYYVADELGSQDPLPKYHHMYEFNPHIVFTIDFVENQIINDNCFLFCWMQDPVAILYNKEAIKIRKRDFYFSLLDEFSNQLIRKNIPKEKIFEQLFCTNPKIFFEDASIKKENKIVFLGSDYDYYGYDINCGEYPHLKKLIKDLKKLIKEGNLTLENIQTLALKYKIPVEWAKMQIAGTLVRKEVIKWVCKQQVLPVEIYGTDKWLQIPEVAPFYKGLLPYGSEMAKVYNSAKYGIFAHVNYFYQQRVFEMSACNTIPLGYSGLVEENFVHYDNVLLFSTYKELLSQIGKEPKKSPKQISEDISFNNLTKKVTTIVKEEING